MISSYITTTGEKLEHDVRWAWSKFVNKRVSLENSAITPISSPIEWNYGFCFECNFPVAKTATGCPNCHITFID